jgi:hypothetical protein
MAALIRHGIYLTTDLFVSRGIKYGDIGIDRSGEIPMNEFKVLVPVHEGAFNNWKQFARSLLCHTNAYTHRRYADEPALAWLAMINEGNFGNFVKEMQTIPEWKEAWNQWLGKKYSGKEQLAAAWHTELKDNEDPAARSVELPEKIYSDGLRTRDFIAFLADTDREMVQRMKRFLREDLGCRALISNSSSWTRFTTDQGARMIYDYVDDHFYVDHPKFLETSWRLPSRCPNSNPLAEGAPGGRPIAFTRLFDKPFTVTEYNYSAPGQFRGLGGILTGGLGALQGWGGIWRFAYSHSRDALFNPARMDYFNMAGDPLSQAAERASICLFLRGDLQVARESVAVTMTEADLAHPAKKIPTLAPKWNWLAWETRVGTQVVPSGEASIPATAILPLAWQTPPSDYKHLALPLDPYSVSDNTLLEALKERNVISRGPAIGPEEKFLQSQTGEILIDGPRGRLSIDTPRTAGGYAPEGQLVHLAKGYAEIKFIEGAATVWVSALDDEPIHRSRRLLVTHLTDLQNTDIRYAERARQTLLDWGHLPYLVKAGKAEVTLWLDSPRSYKVWALSPGGKRLQTVPAKVESKSLRFTADVAGDPQDGARMLYEVVRAN